MTDKRTTDRRSAACVPQPDGAIDRRGGERPAVRGDDDSQNVVLVGADCITYHSSALDVIGEDESGRVANDEGAAVGRKGESCRPFTTGPGLGDDPSGGDVDDCYSARGRPGRKESTIG